MCSVPRGSITRPPSPRTSGLVRLIVSSTLSSRGVAESSSGRSAGNGHRQSRQVTHAAAIEPGLAARLGVDVADLIEESEGVVVPQRMGALAARHVGGHDLVEVDVEDGGLRCQWRVPSCK